MAAAAARCLDPFPDLCVAFLSTHSHVKSSAALRDALAELRAVSARREDALGYFAVPVSRNLLSMEKMFLWVAFLRSAAQKGHVMISSEFDTIALDSISSHFNLDHSNLVDVHLQTLSDETASEGEDSDED